MAALEVGANFNGAKNRLRSEILEAFLDGEANMVIQETVTRMANRMYSVEDVVEFHRFLREMCNEHRGLEEELYLNEEAFGEWGNDFQKVIEYILVEGTVDQIAEFMGYELYKHEMIIVILVEGEKPKILAKLLGLNLLSFHEVEAKLPGFMIPGEPESLKEFVDELCAVMGSDELKNRYLQMVEDQREA